MESSPKPIGPLIKTLIFTLVVPATVAGYVPYRILRHYGRTAWPAGWDLRWAGALLVLLGAGGYLWCALAFALRGLGTPLILDPPTRFVAVGLYRYTRNPMYASLLIVIGGIGALFRSHQVILYGLGLFCCFHLFVVAYEEGALTRRFGVSYEEYRRRVPRWWPRPRAPDGSGRPAG
jgi:protein-S-isoprenylcysteine O-methyltransferase Ste14